MKTIEQLDESEWDEIAGPDAIAILPLSPEDLLKSDGIEFVEFDDDGMGLCQRAGIKIDGTIFALFTHPERFKDKAWLTVETRSFEKDSEKALSLLLEALKIQRNELLWEREDLGPAKWVVNRIDDNGNEFEMYRFQNEHSANWIRMKYEKRGHKQTYFVKKVDDM